MERLDRPIKPFFMRKKAKALFNGVVPRRVNTSSKDDNSSERYTMVYNAALIGPKRFVFHNPQGLLQYHYALF